MGHLDSDPWVAPCGLTNQIRTSSWKGLPGRNFRTFHMASSRNKVYLSKFWTWCSKKDRRFQRLHPIYGNVSVEYDDKPMLNQVIWTCSIHFQVPNPASFRSWSTCGWTIRLSPYGFGASDVTNGKMRNDMPWLIENWMISDSKSIVLSLALLKFICGASPA